MLIDGELLSVRADVACLAEEGIAVAAVMTAIGFIGGSHCRAGHAARLKAGGTATVVAALAELPPALAGLSLQLR